MKAKLTATLAKILQRLNKIGTPVSGYTSKSVSASTSTTINTINVPAGTWLLLSYMDLSASSSASSYNHYLFGAGVINRVVRSTPYNGGGSVNWAVITGPASVDVIAHVPVACTVRTSYSLIYMGGVLLSSIFKAFSDFALLLSGGDVDEIVAEKNIRETAGDDAEPARQNIILFIHDDMVGRRYGDDHRGRALSVPSKICEYSREGACIVTVRSKQSCGNTVGAEYGFGRALRHGYAASNDVQCVGVLCGGRKEQRYRHTSHTVTISERRWVA